MEGHPPAPEYTAVVKETKVRRKETKSEDEDQRWRHLFQEISDETKVLLPVFCLTGDSPPDTDVFCCLIVFFIFISGRPHFDSRRPP